MKKNVLLNITAEVTRSYTEMFPDIKKNTKALEDRQIERCFIANIRGRITVQKKKKKQQHAKNINTGLKRPLSTKILVP